MARQFQAANEELVYVATTGTYTTNLSFAARVRLASTPSSGQQRCVVSLGNAGGSGIRLNIYLTYRNAAGTLRWNVGYTNGDASYNENYFDDTITTGTWYTVSGSVDWSQNPDSVVLYRDGSSLTVSSTFGSNNVTPDGGSYRFSAGALSHAVSTALWWDGDIADLAIWNAVLTAGDHIAFNAGTQPLLIRTGSLVGFMPFLGGVNDRINGAGTDVNTTSDTDHPPKILRPRSPLRFALAAAAPPPSIIFNPLRGPLSHGGYVA